MLADQLDKKIAFALEQLSELCPAVAHFAKFGGDVPSYIEHGRLLSWHERLCVAKCNVEHAERAATPEAAAGWREEAETLLKAVLAECGWLAESRDSCRCHTVADESIVPEQQVIDDI